MANPEHVEIVKKGATAITKWRKAHPDEQLQLEEAELSREALLQVEPFDAMWRARLIGADLSGANLRKANLSGANLTEANLSGADLTGAKLSAAELSEADLSGAELSEADLSAASLTGVNLSGAIMFTANLRKANLTKADLSGAQLHGVNLAGANLSWANVSTANLHDANLSQASLFEANVGGAYFPRALGVPFARHLDTTEIAKDPPKYFEQVNRGLLDRLLDWERFRSIGRLPLFSVSYAALVLLPVFFYVLDVYNAKVEIAQAWAEQVVAAQEGATDVPKVKLAEVVLQRLRPLPIPAQSMLIIVSTVLLAAGATLYTFFCPSRVKEFSRDQWCDQLGRHLIHYWPLAWKWRYVRVVCALCYLLGGLGAFWVIGTKVLRVAGFVWRNAGFNLT